MSVVLVIANPGKRLDAFLAAARELNMDPPRVFHHEALLHSLEPLQRERFDDVRIDAWGGDPEVERLLMELGREPDGVDARRRQPNELFAPRQVHRGWTRYLKQVGDALQGARLWTPTRTLVELFDKRFTYARLRSAGVSVAESFPVRTVDELRTGVAQRGWKSAFVKLAFGSSGRGIAVWNIAEDTILTTVRREGDRWLNAHELIPVSDRAQVDALFEYIIGEGAHIERTVDLARIEGMRFDLRVLVIAGRPTFVMGRRSDRMMTNLHLGGRRLNWSQLRSFIPPREWEDAMTMAVQVAKLYDCHHVGVDIAFDRLSAKPIVVEVNAFGDYLPDVRRDGLSVMAWELRSRELGSQ